MFLSMVQVNLALLHMINLKLLSKLKEKYNVGVQRRTTVVYHARSLYSFLKMKDTYNQREHGYINQKRRKKKPIIRHI